MKEPLTQDLSAGDAEVSRYEVLSRAMTEASTSTIGCRKFKNADKGTPRNSVFGSACDKHHNVGRGAGQ